MTASAGVRLALSSAAGNVAVVRAALAGIADSLGFDPELASDLKTGISEACNNVSMHAYPEGISGPMWVDLDCLPDAARATVTDRGRGITRIAPDDRHMGLGLAVINALALRSQFNQPAGGGAQVRMWFGAETEGRDTVISGVSDVVGAPPELEAESGGSVLMWCTEDLCPSVLRRTLLYLAATAHFSVVGIDAVRDATSDLCEDIAQTAEQGWVGARLTSTSRRLELTLRRRSGDPDGEVLHLTLTDPGGGDLRMV